MGRRLVLCLLSVSFLSVSCTRGVEDLEVSLELPVHSESLSSSSRLETLIVNLHNVPNKPNPWYFEFNFKRKPFSGVVTIPEVPRARGIIVQVLAVFEEEDTGNATLKYGGKTVDLSQSSDVTIQVIAQNESSRMGEISGRYLNSSGSHPTGKVVGYFRPPDGLPKMKVWDSEIVSGWFRGIALEETGLAGRSAGMDLVVEDENGKVKQTLFESLRFQENAGAVSLFEGVGESPTSIDMNTSGRMVIYKPKHYRLYGDGAIDAEGATMNFIGFFGPGADTGGHKLCFPEVREALMDAKVATGGGEYQPLDVHLSASMASGEKVHRLSGGVVQSLEAHYANLLDACDPGNADHLKLTHTHLAHRIEDAIGVRAPFRSVGFLGDHAEYIQGDFGLTESGKVTLKWQLLPGVIPQNDISGYEIYYRSYANSPGDYDNDFDDDEGNSDTESCKELPLRGFSQFHTSNEPASFEYSFSSRAGEPMEEFNWNNAEYAVCAFKQTNGKKHYVGNYIRSSCLGEYCEGSLTHTGWKAIDVSGSNVTVNTGETFTSMGGRFAQVTGLEEQAGGQSHLIKAKISTLGTDFQPGDEALFVIQSRGTEASCGVDGNGGQLQVGMSYSARVISNGTTPENFILVPNKSWLKHVHPTNLNASPEGGVPHCLIQVVKVLHFRNLTLAAGVEISTTPFDFVSTKSGGVIAMRVNGLLKMNEGSKITASEKGFSGGSASYPHGASSFGAASYTPVTGAAEGKTSNAAGGGGAGAGGRGGNNSLGGGDIAIGGYSVGYSHHSSFVLGGGGGNGHGSSTSFSGGSGGGWILLAAQKFAGPVTGASATIESNGQSKPTDAGDVGGGGGGGTINIAFKESSGQLALSAQGGDGGDNNSTWQSHPGGAGNGGGGYIWAMICDLDEPEATSAGEVTWSTMTGMNAWKSEYGDGSQAGPLKEDALVSKNTPGYEWECRR